MSLEPTIGKRVSIRLVETGGGFRDLLGTLVAPGKIQRRDGSIAEFDQSRVFAYREVAQRNNRAGRGAPFSIRVREIESALSDSWPATEVFDRSGWRYRYADTSSLRGASILPLGLEKFAGPAQEIDDEIKFAKNFYEERGRCAAIHISLPLDQELDDYLASLNWSRSDEIEVHIADLEDLHSNAMKLTSSKVSSKDIEISQCAIPDQSWLDLQGSESIAEILGRGGAEYFSLSDSGLLVGVGRLAIAGQWALLSRIFIAEEFRGRGFATALMFEFAQYLIQLSEDQNSPKKIALQVGSENSAAIALYKKLGFSRHHSYHYRKSTQSHLGAC